MKIAIDSCSIILLAKATVLESLANEHKLFITGKVYWEVLKGKDKNFADALLTERLVKEKKIIVKKDAINSLTKKIKQDFNLGVGEAGTLALVMNNQCEAVITDNKQGRKAALIYKLNLAGSIDVVTALYKLKIMDRHKAIEGLKKLREFGWFQDYLIDNALEEIKNA